jgi:hypothetical protein
MKTGQNDAIVGATGFVGQNLRISHTFSGQFNSRNVAELSGKEYRIVVCAAAPATMWAANKNPDGDLANIRRLIGNLEGVRAQHFVLISTIAVLGDAAAGLDEDTAQFETAKAYGRNRRFLEEAVAGLFPKSHILRLPALFGAGLKKNFLFDILNPVPSFLAADKFAALAESLPAPAAEALKQAYSLNADVGMYQVDRALLVGERGTSLTQGLVEAGFTALNFTNADSTYQYYGLARLWDDIGRAIAHDLPVVHLAPEPLAAGAIYESLTGKTLETRTAPLYREDMRTRHAALWGGPDGYSQAGTQVLTDLKAFYDEARRA